MKGYQNRHLNFGKMKKFITRFQITIDTDKKLTDEEIGEVLHNMKARLEGYTTECPKALINAGTGMKVMGSYHGDDFDEGIEEVSKIINNDDKSGSALRWMMHKLESRTNRYMEAETKLMEIGHTPWYKLTTIPSIILNFLDEQNKKYHGKDKWTVD